jgi:hypothetical protein
LGQVHFVRKIGELERKGAESTTLDDFLLTAAEYEVLHSIYLYRNGPQRNGGTAREKES